MGRRGPAKTPTALKALRGTRRPDREPANEPQPAPIAPRRPSWLGKAVPWGREAVREWQRLAPTLNELGLLTEPDRAEFAAYCDAYARWWYFRRRIARVYTTQVTESGYVAPRPEVSMMHRALDDLKKFGALFGLSPSDRAGLDVTPPAAPKRNAFEMIK